MVGASHATRRHAAATRQARRGAHELLELGAQRRDVVEAVARDPLVEAAQVLSGNGRSGNGPKRERGLIGIGPTWDRAYVGPGLSGTAPKWEWAEVGMGLSETGPKWVLA